MKDVRARFVERFQALARTPGHVAVPEWRTIRADDPESTLVVWLDSTRRRALQLSEAETGQGDYVFERWGAGVVDAAEEVDLLCLDIEDAAAHAADVYAIYQQWLVDAVPQDRVELILEALSRR